MVEFEPFPSLKRLYREITVTEKIDGTNAQICVTEDGQVIAGSRNRWITPDEDNAGFARWVAEREADLRDDLGVGRHFGEWWGAGIQRRYDQSEKIFSLFNTSRWHGTGVPRHCSVVPVLYTGMFSDDAITTVLEKLRKDGSVAAPGFMDPEGIVVYHSQARQSFKVTLDNNDKHKWEELES